MADSSRLTLFSKLLIIVTAATGGVSLKHFSLKLPSFAEPVSSLIPGKSRLSRLQFKNFFPESTFIWRTCQFPDGWHQQAVVVII